MTEALDSADIDAFADGIFAAIEGGDVDAIDAMWDTDIVVWHNTDGVEQSKTDNLRVLGWMSANTVSRDYRGIRRTIVADGFHQQHVLHLEFADGRSADLPAALFVRVSARSTGGHAVTRIDEYIDGAAVAKIFTS